MNIVVRGGQTTLHYIRMLKQIVASIVKIAMFVIVMFVLYNMYKSSISVADIKIYFQYFYSKISSNLTAERSYITSNPEVIELVNYINDTLYVSFIQGIRYGFASTIIVTIFFAFRGFLMAQKKIVRGKQILSPSKLKFNILLYNFTQNVLNLENHLEFIVIVVSILWHSLLLGLKSLYNCPITLFKFFSYCACEVMRCANIICPSLTSKLSPKEHKFFFFMKRINVNELDINKHLKSIDKNYKRILSLYSSIKLAGIPYPKKSTHVHTLITGEPGTGKTVLISSLIKQIRKKGQKAIIYDKMGVFTKRFYDPKTDIILNPMDQRSYNWDITKECKSRSHCDNIAAAFIPNRSSASDPFWENAARILLSEVLHQAINLQELIDLLFKDEDRLIEIIESSVALKRILPKDSKKTSGSIISVLYSYVYSLQLLENNSNQKLSIREWISDDNQKGFLIISSKADSQETLRPLLTAIFETAINSILSLEDNPHRNLWVLLDELPSLQYIPSLQSALSQSRQFGASFVLALQVMSQLKDLYGDRKAESVSGSCSNRVVFSTPDKDTANWCSKSLGDVEVEEVKESVTYGSHDMRDGVSANKQISITNLVLPTEIMNLRKLNCFLRFGLGFGVAKVKLKITKYKNKAEGFIECKTLHDKMPSKIEEIINDDEDINPIPELEDNNSMFSEEFLEEEDEALNEEEENLKEISEEEDTVGTSSSIDDDSVCVSEEDTPDLQSTNKEDIYNKF